jgi:hypothetical protein
MTMATEPRATPAVSEAATEPAKTQTREEAHAANEAKFHKILEKQREESAKTQHVMTREERAKQTEEFTAKIAKQSEGKHAVKPMTYEEKEANKVKMLAILDKQREDMAKGKKV